MLREVVIAMDGNASFGERLALFMQGLQRTWFAINKAPTILAMVLAIALWQVGQFHELYISIAEQLYSGAMKGAFWNLWGALSLTGLQAAIALVVMFVISAMILISNAKLGGHRLDQAYQDFNARVTDPHLAAWVNVAGRFAASLPWLGLFAGIDDAFKKADRHISSVSCGEDKGSDLCAEFHFEGLKVAAIEFDESFQAFQSQLKSWLWYLDWLPSFFWLVGIAAVLLIAWELGATQLFAAWQTRSFSRAQLSLVRTPRTKADRGRDRKLYRKLVVFPYLQRSVGDFIVAAVAFVTFADLVVPFVIERIIPWLSKLPRINSVEAFLPTWPSWESLFASLQPFSLPWLMPNKALGLGVLLAIWLGMLMFISFKRLPRRRPSWIDVPANCVVAASGLVIIWLAGGLWGLAGIVASVVLYVGLVAYIKARPDRQEQRLHRLFQAIAILSSLCLAATTLSVLMAFGWVEISRAAGPLAVSLLLACIIMSIVIGMCHIGRHTKVPLVFILFFAGLAIVANKLEWAILWRLFGMLIFLAIAWMLFAARRRAAGFLTIGVAVVYLLGHYKVPPDEQKEVAKQPDNIAVAFGKWFDARRVHELSYRQRRPQQKYPVFIVAAEGGGIYAAAAISAFMARLQERCPSFAQHVFAISGVSGGAVGSVVFHGAVNGDKMALAADGCSDALDTKKGIQARVARVIKDDHLSPLAGLIVPDILGTFSDRSWGLTESLDLSMREHFGIREADAPWRNAFPSHWDHRRPAPALVLNTTWVRVGNRVVFAPFEFDDQSLVTLSTFAGLHKKHSWCTPVHEMPLVRAAVTSARFPGVLAAYETRKNCTAAGWISNAPDKGVEDRRWSFVDGGYIDASGAQTAQEIYSSIEGSDIGKSLRNQIDLRLILLTDAQEIKEEHGTIGAELRDLTAPIFTMFSVRSLLSRVAVRETIAKLSPGSVDAIANLSHAAQMPGASLWKVMSIELNHDDVQLELGWKMSNLTHDLVSLQLGQADLCAKAKPPALEKRESKPQVQADKLNSQEAKRQKALGVAKTIRANSCVMASIEALLK